MPMDTLEGRKLVDSTEPSDNNWNVSAYKQGANNEASLCRTQERLGNWKQGGDGLMKIDWNLGYLSPSPTTTNPGI